VPRLRPDPALPWERQPEESDPAYEAFSVYRDMPLTPYRDGGQELPGRPRSNREVARRLHKGRSLIDRWGSRHAWVERCRVYDADLDRERLSAQRHAAVAAVRQHAQLAAAAVGSIGLPLRALSKPQQLYGDDGQLLRNEDGAPLTRDRSADLEAMTTPALLLLMRQVASLLPVVIAIRMDALGNPNEPLPEVPEWGQDPETEEHTTPDRMLEILRAAEESGVLQLTAGLTREAEQAAEVEAAHLGDDVSLANGHAP
jgi:hypothetical protein